MFLTNSFLARLASSAALLLAALPAPAQTQPPPTPPAGGNPIIKTKHTADPAALVQAGTVYLYTGHAGSPQHPSRYPNLETALSS